jgi:hypothetical protein
LTADERRKFEEDVAAARAALGKEAFTIAWQAGQALPQAAAVDYAVE